MGSRPSILPEKPIPANPSLFSGIVPLAMLLPLRLVRPEPSPVKTPLVMLLAFSP